MKRKHTMVRMAVMLAILLAGMTVLALPGAAQTTTSSATLWIYGELSTDTSAEVRVHQVLEDWTETGVTWNTRPSFDGTIAGSFTSGTGWLSVDVTGLAQAWATGSPNYGLLLEQHLAGYGIFTAYSSREGSMSPYLVLCRDTGCETLYPAADAYIREGQPDVNYGTYEKLYTGYVQDTEKQSLIRFDIPEVPCGEGCTPGYWKNHLDSWPPTGYAPSDDFDTTFGVDYFDPDISLEQAVNRRGGKVNRLARHGTAALLSAAHPDVDYPYTVAEVIAFVQAGDADPLVEANELGCPID